MVRDIPITINSDAHSAKDIDGLFEAAKEKLQRIGFTKQKILQSGLWVDVDITGSNPKDY